MDTVVFAKGSLKCILTMYFPDTELLLAYLMNRCTPGETILKTVIDNQKKPIVFKLVFNHINECLAVPDIRQVSSRQRRFPCNLPGFLRFRPVQKKTPAAGAVEKVTGTYVVKSE